MEKGKSQRDPSRDIPEGLEQSLIGCGHRCWGKWWDCLGAGLVVGVAGATSSQSNIILASGIAGIVAGAISMAAGGYVSVSSSGIPKALLKKKPMNSSTTEQELEELWSFMSTRIVRKKTAMVVAKELTESMMPLQHMSMGALGIDPNDPDQSLALRIASTGSFLVGAIIPIIAILLPHNKFVFPSPLFPLSSYPVHWVHRCQS